MGKNRWWATVRVFFSFLMAVVLTWGLVACGERLEATESSDIERTSKTQLRGSLSEDAPPPVIQQLSQTLDIYQPQVSIVSPNPDQVLQDTTVSVKFQVQDLPIFKDPDFELGPHLHVILDNQPYKAVYNLDQPLVFEDLAPGTHTIRVFASRPWHESFKNEGAYAQTTFHIFTKTSDNNPDPALPLLTYSRPTGSYGAEPIMLDFYLTNAPLHLVAQENPDDNIADWRIRVTVNGESFVIDRWQPIYLKGFKKGQNWVQLEFLDEKGNPIKNAFNDTVRLINYEPKGKDTLSKLVRGQISAQAARGIVDPNYKTTGKQVPLPELTPSPSPSPEETLTPLPELTPSPRPSPEETLTPLPPVEETPTESVTPTEPVAPETQPLPVPPSAPTAAPQQEKPKSGGLFGRFRRAKEAPTPSPEPVLPEEPEQTLQPEVTTTPSEFPTPIEEQTPDAQPTPIEVVEPQKPKFGGFWNRFRRPAVAPSSEPSVVTEQEQSEPEPFVIPSESPASVEESTSTNQPVAPETSLKKAETPEIPNSEPTAKPKLNLKEVLLSPPAPSTPPKIIQAPAQPELDIPNRFLKQSTPTEPTTTPESSDAPTADSETTNVPIEADGS